MSKELDEHFQNHGYEYNGQDEEWRKILEDTILSIVNIGEGRYRKELVALWEILYYTI